MPHLLYLHDNIFNFKKYHIIFTILSYCLLQLLWHNYARVYILGFYAFQSVFFATIYN